MTANKDQSAPDDDVLRALHVLIEALEENAVRNRDAVRRARRAVQSRRRGASYREIIEAEERPLVVEMITANINNLMQAGSKLRRAEACALHAEGLSMEEIGTLFGVSRQRVGALINKARRSV